MDTSQLNDEKSGGRFSKNAVNASAASGLWRRSRNASASARIVVRTAGTNDVVRMIIDDEAHMGMVFQAAPDAKIRVRASSDQPLKVILRPDHPLGERASLKISDLVGERLGVPEKSFRIRQILAGAESEENGVRAAGDLEAAGAVLVGAFAWAGAALRAGTRGERPEMSGEVALSNCTTATDTLSSLP